MTTKRKRTLKVWTGLHFVETKQYPAIIAAHNAKEVAAALRNASERYVRDYWSVTGNTGQIAAAMAQPGVLLIERERHSGKYEVAT